MNRPTRNKAKPVKQYRKYDIAQDWKYQYRQDHMDYQADKRQVNNENNKERPSLKDAPFMSTDSGESALEKWLAHIQCTQVRLKAGQPFFQHRFTQTPVP